MKRAVGYARVSTEEQGSLEAQQARIRAYGVAQDLKLVDVLVDDGVSGGKPLGTRPAGAEIVRLVKKKEVGAVVAFKLDRLFRNAQDCLATSETWAKKGIALHLIDMGGQAVDTTSAMGRFFLTMMAGMAEWERGVIRERTRLALQHKRERGEKLGGATPYGYGVDVLDEVPVLVPLAEEQKMVELVCRLRSDGLSLRKITNQLNEQHRDLARGRRWHETTVVRIIERVKRAS